MGTEKEMRRQEEVLVFERQPLPALEFFDASKSPSNTFILWLI